MRSPERGKEREEQIPVSSRGSFVGNDLPGEENSTESNSAGMQGAEDGIRMRMKEEMPRI